jgi:c-di-GMP-binding flagellar brake protein YcgR
MWQAPNQRVGAIQNSKKRQQERLKRPIHLKRVRAAMRLVPNQQTHAQATTQDAQGEQIEIRVLLNDLSTSGIGIYAQTPMAAGSEVQITLDEPKRIQISGTVVWCQDQPTGGAIISSEAYHFRIGVKFHFANPEEEKALQDYCAEIQKQHLYRPGP